jgi:hypothetical protein
VNHSYGGSNGRGRPDVSKAVRGAERRRARAAAKARSLSHHEDRIIDRIAFEAEVERMKDQGRLQARCDLPSVSAGVGASAGAGAGAGAGVGLV